MPPRLAPLARASAALLALGVAQAAPADFVVLGPIRTMAKAAPVAGAMAVAGGKIVYVGDAESARKLLGSDGKIIALKPDQMVLPGIVDSHVHPLSAGLKAQGCVLEPSQSKEEMMAAIAAYAKAHPDLEWIEGSSWPPTLNPTLAELDAATPGRPALFHGQDAHSAWANSAALKIAGITRSTVDPELGSIDRDPDTGEATGALRETAVYLVESHIPKPTPGKWQAALQYAQSQLHALGITLILDANVSPQMLEVYRDAQKAGTLTLKANLALATDPAKPPTQVDDFVHLRDQFSTPQVTISTAKIFVDGVLEGKTAALLQPYAGTDYKGFLNWSPGRLNALVQKLDQAGFQVYMHAIGDRAVREGLDAMEAARKANGPSDHRHQITHVELVDPADIPRFAALDVTANFQPFWWSFSKGRDDHRVSLIGVERAERLYPVRVIMNQGGAIVSGSDWPITNANPFQGIEAALTHPTNQKTAGDPSPTLDLEKLLEAGTVEGAFVNHREKETGSLEVGKAADFIVLDRNLFASSPAEIGATKVLATFADGKQVFGKPLGAQPEDATAPR